MFYLILNKDFVERPANEYLRGGFFLIGTTYYNLRFTQLDRVSVVNGLISVTNNVRNVIHYGGMYYRYFNLQIYSDNRYDNNKQLVRYIKVFNNRIMCLQRDYYDLVSKRVV